MALPNYRELYGPIMNVLMDGFEKPIDDMKGQVAGLLKLTVNDVAQCSESGTKPLFDNRFRKACADLKRTGFIEKVGRSTYRITDAGKKAATQIASGSTNEWKITVAHNEFQRLGEELRKIVDDQESKLGKRR